MINAKFLRLLRTFLIIIAVLGVIYPGKVNISHAARVLKIGYVDVQKVITDSDAGKKAIKYLQREYEGKGEIIRKRRAEIKKLSKELSKLKPALDKEGKRRKEEEYQRAQRDLKIFMENSNQEVVDKEKEIIEKMASEIIGLVQSIAKDKGYTMIFDNSKTTDIILYASDETDITAEVIKRYNHTGASITY